MCVTCVIYALNTASIVDFDVLCVCVAVIDLELITYVYVYEAVMRS